MVLPIVAAGAAVGGQLINSSGQNSALKAVERAYAAARERQQGFDQQSFEATRDMIDGISPDSLVPVAVQNEMTQRGAADTANITRAVGTQAARRGGGRNAESLAVMNQNMPGVQMRANEEGALAALMAAWNQGGYDLTRGRRELDMERQRLSADATAWQAMLPVDLRHAQKKGQASRQLGTLLSLFGQYGINSAMAQPKEPAGTLKNTTADGTKVYMGANTLASTPGAALNINTGQPVVYGANTPDWQNQQAESLVPTLADLFR